MNMTEKSGEIWAVIEKSENILLHLHPSPDADSIGGALAMGHILSALGKKATVISGDSPLPERFAILPGYDKIEEKTFSDLDLSQYDLFLILDSSDLDRITQAGKVVFPSTLKTVVIDHHVSNTNFADVNLVDPEAPATAQMLFQLFESWDVEISSAAAICLLTGIYGDTGGFAFKRTTSQTFAAAGRLAEIYPDFSKVMSELNSHNTAGSLRFKSLAYGAIETIGKGQIAIIALDHYQLTEKSLSREDITGQNLANSLISVKDWPLGISLIEKEPNETYISFRSRKDDKYDVSKVAVSLGGGGHPPAAGAFFAGSASEAKKAVEKILQGTFPDLF